MHASLKPFRANAIWVNYFDGGRIPDPPHVMQAFHGGERTSMVIAHLAVRLEEVVRGCPVPIV